MGKNIALLIGISEYQTESDLPPCQKDMELMHAIVSGSEKYDDVLVLDSSPKSSGAKEKISGFIRKYQSQNIEEVFVYYTGHGAKSGDDFLYLFSDFNNSKIEQTSLRNSEFDSMIKSLNPGLTVKVVDACQAGTEYIKSNQDLQVIFEKSSSESFNKTYFLFSSSNSEGSVALHDYSVFTKSVAKSLLEFKGQEIRYRDIMAYVSDDRDVTKYQTPLFIQQADNTEIFCSVSEDIFKDIYRRISHNVAEYEDSNNLEEDKPSGASELTEEENLVEAIRAKGKYFCSEEQAQDSLKYLVKLLTSFNWPTFIGELFEVDSNEQQYTVELESKKSLAKWIKDNDEPYFVRMIYDQEEYEAKEKVVYEDSQPIAIASILGAQKRIEYRPVTRYKNVLSSYEITAPSPSQTVIISLEPKEEVLPWFKVFLPIYSQNLNSHFSISMRWRKKPVGIAVFY